MTTDLKQRIRDHAVSLGFGLTGFTSADPLPATHEGRWRRWRALDRAGAMRYLMRERPRRTHPRDLLPSARSCIVLAAGYHAGDHGPPPPPGAGARGKVARYAWGRDYHDALRERLHALGEFVAAQAAAEGIAEPVQWRPCVDSAPLDERALAVRAGLGFIGKNTLLLHPEHGSFMLLAVLLISLELPPDEPLPPGPTASCGACRRCIEACPTGAIEDAFRLDPRRCVSYLTIEQRDEIPADLAARMEGWAFGCDICQEVCPYNAAPLARLMPELAPEHGAGPWISEATLDETPSGKSFLRRWAETPLARPGQKGLRRNLRALCGGERGTDPRTKAE